MREYPPTLLAWRLTAVFCGLAAIWLFAGDDDMALVLNIFGYAAIATAVLPWGGLHRHFWLPFVCAVAAGAIDITKLLYAANENEFLYHLNHLDGLIFLVMLVSLFTGYAKIARQLGRSDLAYRSERLRDRYLPLAFVGVFVCFLVGALFAGVSTTVGGGLMIAAMALYMAVPLAILGHTWTLRNAARNRALMEKAKAGQPVS